jgi:hypothetical protein
MMIKAARAISKITKIWAHLGANKIRPVAIADHQDNATHTSPT